MQRTTSARPSPTERHRAPFFATVQPGPGSSGPTTCRSVAGTETLPNQGSRALITHPTYRGYFSAVSKPILANQYVLKTKFAASFNIYNICAPLYLSKLKISKIKMFALFNVFCRMAVIFSLQSTSHNRQRTTRHRLAY